MFEEGNLVVVFCQEGALELVTSCPPEVTGSVGVALSPAGRYKATGEDLTSVTLSYSYEATR